MAGLVYVRDSDPGLRRRRAGKGFAYLDTHGRAVRDAETLARIRKLAIPPAYVDVWISTHPRAHLQATGRDARGRKQYRYHPQWRRVRDRDKYATMAGFAAALPALRRRLARDLKLPGLPREKVLAAAVSVMADTSIRVGNSEYARSNGSFGLTTLRSRHVGILRGNRVKLRFRGKGGLVRECLIDDPRVVKLIRRCHPLPGQALFQYCVDGDCYEPIDSSMVNDYLREVMGGDYTAKDFRTWRATRGALEALARTPLPTPASERALKSIELGVVREIAAQLGNTPAVARNSYIDPIVFSAWRSGALQRSFSATAPRTSLQVERWAERFLRRARRGR
nr:DNA topoisomerase IB [Chiayiivirga flava]